MTDSPDLSGYKTNVDSITRGRLKWSGDLAFQGRTQRGYELDFDANIEWGCSPTEALLLSLAGCLAIDVLSILKKQRMDIKTFTLDVEGERNPEPPQFYKSVLVTLHLKGKNIDQGRVDRAVRLSQEKYCSVRHSMRADMEMTIDTVIDQAI